MPLPGAARTWALRALVLAGAALALHAVWQSWRDIHAYGGCDLRDKVVFARLLRAGIDPYFAAMAPDWPERLITPLYYHGAVRISVTPVALCLYLPLCELDYGTQRAAWFALEWSALAAAVVLLALVLRPNRGRLELAALALWFFAGGYFWRLHVERGQYYVFVLLLLALSAWLATRRRQPVPAGIPLGLAVALRPSLLAIPVVFWALGYRKTAVAAGAACLTTVAACLPFTGLQSWTHYTEAIRRWELEATDPERLPSRETHPLPKRVEGIDFTAMLPARTANTGLPGLCAFLPESAAPLRPYASWGFKILAVTLVAGVAWRLCVQRRPRRASHALAVAAIVALNLDYLLAPVRYGYADVLLLLPLALLLPLWLHLKPAAWLAVVAVGGLLLGHVLNDELGTILRTVLVMGGLNLTLLLIFLRGRGFHGLALK